MPPGLFVVVLLILTLCAVRGRTKIALFLALFTLSFYLLSIQIVSDWFLAAPLETAYKKEIPLCGKDTAVLILGGGVSYAPENGNANALSLNTLARVFEGTKLAKCLGNDTVIILSAGDSYNETTEKEYEIMNRTAKDMGWRGKTILETRSRTTAENMKYSAEIIHDLGIKNVAVVTNAFHIYRSMEAAKLAMPDVNLFPYPSSYMANRNFYGAYSFLPAHQNFSTSCTCIREIIGILFLKIKGL
ncbi:MAG: YdcF family protein [Synergistes sp.]|nr:YdcF family protein [Synergistes sp.]